MELIRPCAAYLDSYRVMEKNGGVLENKEWHEEEGKHTLIRRYWIELR